MSQTRVPVTNAFDETDRLQSLEVELTPRQIEWLEQRAEERGLSLDHMLRSVVTAQIRGMDEDASLPSPPGDGAPESSANDPSPPNRAPRTPASEQEGDDPPSIVESLRTASERLQDLTDDEGEPDTLDLRDTIARLEDRIDASADEEASAQDPPTEGGPSDGGLLDDQSRSMFDMVEE